MSGDEFLFHPGAGDRTVVLLPGFATDHRIFEGLFPGAARVCPANVDPSRLPDSLFAYLRRSGAGPVTLFGWSLGAFVASDFARAYPGCVNGLVLAGVRKRYERSALDRFRRSLEENREKCLADFYVQCFLPPQRTEYRRFRERLLPSYLKEMDAGRLARDLRYLQAAEIRPELLPAVPVTFIHGARDVVAPVAEARELAAKVPAASLHVLPDAAHAVFLAPEFASVAERAETC